MMNKIQAINILTNLANVAQKSGIIQDIMEAGSIYTALVVLSQDIPQPNAEQQNDVEKTEENIVQATEKGKKKE